MIWHRRLTAEARAVLRDPILSLWALYVLLSPVYVFPSGLPQPGDLILIVLTPLTLATWDRRMAPITRRPLALLVAFTGYVLINNLTWTILTGSISLSLKKSFVLSPVFYVYNLIAFVTCLLLFRRYDRRFVTLTVWLSLASVVLQTLVTFVYSGSNSDGGRGVGLFNNPNQLGYFAVLSASVILLGQRALRLSSWTVSVGLLCSTYLALYSASKAAIGCVAIIACVGVFARLRTVLLSLAVAGVALLAFDPASAVLARAQDRIRTDQTAGFFEERGYDRITSHPEFWLLGAGEGKYERFADTTVIGDHELHSSAGTVFFCYGVVGSLLFLAFLGRLMVGAPLRVMVLLLPAAAYGLTHQGLRVTLFWMLLALFLCLKEARLRARGIKQPSEKTS